MTKVFFITNDPRRLETTTSSSANAVHLITCIKPSSDKDGESLSVSLCYLGFVKRNDLPHHMYNATKMHLFTDSIKFTKKKVNGSFEILKIMWV